MERAAPVYIGWDVGGWNCDKNRESRDALVILDADSKKLGTWRGNIRRSIEEAQSTHEWLRRLLELCGISTLPGDLQVTIAIDAPLGLPSDLVRLAANRSPSVVPPESGKNPYLFRQTERFLLGRGWTPLSAVKDMIGSQATKAMHALARFAPQIETCGVWTDGKYLRAIETYPAVARDAFCVRESPESQPAASHKDLQDALTCAVVARLFATQPSLLEPPDASIPSSEGWIWAPRHSYRFKEIRATADKVARAVTRQTVVHLQTMRDTLSGELETTWEEICVQVQGEHSVLWDAYDLTARQAIEGQVALLPAEQVQWLWLQTISGEEWIDQQVGGSLESPGFNEQEVVDYLKERFLYPAADEWSNARTRAFFERRYERD